MSLQKRLNKVLVRLQRLSQPRILLLCLHCSLITACLTQAPRPTPAPARQLNWEIFDIGPGKRMACLDQNDITALEYERLLCDREMK